MKFSGETESACAAWGTPGKDHVITGCDIRHAVANAFDDPCAFVTKQEWEPLRPEDAIPGGEIGVANSTGEDPDARFARTGSGDKEFFDGAGLPDPSCHSTLGDNRLCHGILQGERATSTAPAAMMRYCCRPLRILHDCCRMGESGLPRHDSV
jgi:hypothetical protein